jgi:hypothetical protein
MDVAMWAYAWDLLDEGVGSVVDRLDAIGVDEISLATNYHHVQAFLPHNPERRTFFARASSYFQPGDGYGELAPVPNEAMGDEDWLDRIIAGVEDSPLTLNSWTIGCHNSRLGMRHPDATLRNAFGDSLAFGLCPSNPRVRRFLTALVDDLDGRGCFERIELETFDYFYGTGYGWHHDKFHAELGTLGEFLFGVCFCEHCRANAADAGVDVESARETVREAFDGIVAGAVPAGTDPGAWLRANPTVADYLAVRTGTLDSLYAELADGTDADLGYYFGLLDVDRTWMHGVDGHALADHLDYYLVPAYESSREDALATVAGADALTPDVPLHAGVLPGHPAIHDPDTLTDVVTGLADAGVPRLSFYNYGLLPEANLEWIERAIDAVRRVKRR